MSIPLRVLIIEDSEDDTLLLVRTLRRGSYDPTYERVDTPAAMKAALERQKWDVVIADYAMPHFSAPAALALFLKSGLDLPFIVVSGTIGEEIAVETMKAGAHDYVMKDNLVRLLPAIERELRDAEMRRERKRVEKALAYEQYLLFTLMNNSPDNIYFKDTESCFIRVNKAMAGWLGLSDPAQAVDKTNFDFFTEEHAHRAYEDEQVVMRSGQPVIKKEKETWPDGRVTWVSTTKGLLHDKERCVIGTFGISRDVTEQVQAEEALRESEENLRITLDSIGDAVIATDTEGDITRMNPVAEALTGWSQEEAKGRPLPEVFNIVDEQTRKPVENPAERILKNGKIEGLANQATLIAKTGAEYQIASSVAPIRNSDGTIIGMVLVFRDVTESRRLEQAKVNFINAISHELRTPLTPILGYAEMMAAMDSPFEERKPILQEIIKSVHRERDLVDELLDIARLQNRQERYSFVEINAGELLKNIFDNSYILVKQMIKERYKTEDFTYSTHISDDLETAIIEVDPDRIQQIVENLLTNAIKYSSSDLLWIECRAGLDGEYVVVSVHDRGRGIPQSEQGQIFKSFYQVRDGSSDVSDGIGQGLTLVKRYAEAHCGTITVESEPGRGSLFILALPLKKRIDPSPAAKSLVLIEDDPVNAKFIKLLLEKHGWAVDVAESGQAGLTAIRHKPALDFVILDMQLEDMDGVRVIEQLEKTSHPPVVILCSARPQEQLIQITNSHPIVKGYVAKPFNIDELINVIG